MERVAILVLVAQAMLNVTASALDNTTTLEELFHQQFGGGVQEMSLRALSVWSARLDLQITASVDPFSGNATWLPLAKEILQYLRTVQFMIMSEFASNLDTVTLQSLYKDLNDHCADDLEMPIEDLTVELSNLTCVSIRLRKTLTRRLAADIEASLHKFSRDCAQQLLFLCSTLPANCTVAYEEKIGKLLGNYLEWNNEDQLEGGTSPLDFINKFLFLLLRVVTTPYESALNFLAQTAFLFFLVPSLEPFTMENVILTTLNNEDGNAFLNKDSTTQTQGQLSWGIVTSSAGTLDHPCLHYRDIYPRDSQEYTMFLRKCISFNILLSIFQLIDCAYTDPTSIPLTWSTAPSAYFHSQCLCLAYNGTDCGVKVPQEVDPRVYCFSVLLRDFQRQVSYRPAVTYLDYASQTRVPVCQFINLLLVAYESDCRDPAGDKNTDVVLSVQCYLNGLLNKNLNCTEIPEVYILNHTELCDLHGFMQFVICQGDVAVPVPYYGPGKSTLVLVLTYLEVAVRVFTLVTYLACPELRNLPGKLLIGYQVTALLRILVVRASLEDLSLAVRLDVATDLASTLWLTSYLHFLTESIKALRLPDSLSPAEALMVLLRYALLGWALPVVLSAAFFSMDEALDSRLQFGQLLFVLCNFVALFGNIFMFIQNCLFYHDIKSSAIKLRKDAGARSVFVDLFIFALKTSLLSGAGITFRLVFTQIQGLEHLLGYYHVLSTLQGLLFFVLYGCNREGRAFCNLVVFTKLPQWLCRQNTTP